MHAPPVSQFAAALITWHRDHGRHDLPWQRTGSPYHIWLSEIMLQQTQVASVIPYYTRFLQRFPDLSALAAAPLDEVLGLWSGLGYYARARNLHRTARLIENDYGGRFPEQPQDIAQLPGVGRSTAAAIAVFAFGARAAILDGNVKRVLCRAYGIDGWPGSPAVEQRLWALAESLLPSHDHAVYIQAQMDLGATMCTRSRPACERCPLAAQCVAYATGRTTALPTPRPRRAVPQTSARFALIFQAGQVLLERRPPAGVWGGLLAPPEIPLDACDAAAWLVATFSLEARAITEHPPLEHAFSHFRLTLQPVHFDVAGHARGTLAADESRHLWLPLDQLDGAALPAPVRKLLTRCASQPPVKP
jgi:A/G-specific adenine glycosylase